MAVIRFFDNEVFTTDSQEYEILENAVKQIKGVEGAVVEIGTRRGGSAKLIIDTLTANEDTDRSMFCLDPYGNIELECTNINMKVHYNAVFEDGVDPMSKEQTVKARFDYDNNMRNTIIPSLYFCAYRAGLNFSFFCMEDTEFFNRFADGVPVYDQFKRYENNYALVFFDGPHTNEAVKTELEFFEPRTKKGAIFIMDDVWMLEHDKIVEQFLFDRGWKVLEKKNIKASYIKNI